MYTIAMVLPVTTFLSLQSLAMCVQCYVHRFCCSLNTLHGEVLRMLFIGLNQETCSIVTRSL